MPAKRKTGINTAPPVKTGLFALFYAQGARSFEITGWGGRHKTRAEAQRWLSELTRWYCDHGAVMRTGDDVGSVTMTRGGRWFTIRISEVMR